MKNLICERCDNAGVVGNLIYGACGWENCCCVPFRKRIDALQAKIDVLMLEYCPEEMTKEQKENWAKHQVLAGDTQNG